jgi:hypothetical protein
MQDVFEPASAISSSLGPAFRPLPANDSDTPTLLVEDCDSFMHSEEDEEEEVVVVVQVEKEEEEQEQEEVCIPPKRTSPLFGWSSCP